LNLNHSNLYSGNTTVNGGTLQASTSGAIPSSSNIAVNTGGTVLLNASSAAGGNVTLSGGKLALSTSGSVSESLGSLTLTTSSTIDFGGQAGSSILFTGLSSYSGQLTINNWSASDNLAFSSNNNLAAFVNNGSTTNVQFNIGGVDYGARVIADPNAGFAGDYELVAIPEPRTIAAGLLLILLICFKECRRAWSLVFKQEEILDCIEVGVKQNE